MPSLKSVLGVIGALAPVVYCGWLVYYFLDVSGSAQEASTNGLGPTVLGLAVVGMLFCIPLFIKVMRTFMGTRPPEDPDASSDEGGFDADAAIARYMARQSADDPSPASPPPSGGPAKSFGRKSR